MFVVLPGAVAPQTSKALARRPHYVRLLGRENPLSSLGAKF